MLIFIALLIFLVFTNWLFSGLLTFLPIQLFDSLGHGLGWLALIGFFLLISWFFGE